MGRQKITLPFRQGKHHCLGLLVAFSSQIAAEMRKTLTFQDLLLIQVVLGLTVEDIAAAEAIRQDRETFPFSVSQGKIHRLTWH